MLLTIENSFTEYRNIVTVKDLQKMLDVGRNTAYDLLHNGDIKSIRIGRIHKIPKVNVIEYINRQNISV